MKTHEEILEPYAFEEPTYGSANPRELITQSDALNAMQQAVDQYKAGIIAEFERHKSKTGYLGDKLFFDRVILIIETFDSAKLKTQ